jgi:hypothetical protein
MEWNVGVMEYWNDGMVEGVEYWKEGSGDDVLLFVYRIPSFQYSSVSVP